MLGLIVLAILGAIVWKLWTPGLTFTPGFGSLLERPAGKSGWWPFLAGVETIGGEYRGRPVVLIVHHKRGRHSLGYLTVAMQPLSTRISPAASSVPLRESIREPAARGAWDELELRHQLKLSFADGWMRAVWQPGGLFIFPGQFERERWSRVLESMHAVVTSMEQAGATGGPGS
jgi:hypothetical protein